MVATAAMIAQVSEYTVSDSGNQPFTTALFTYLSGVAWTELTEALGPNSGMPSDIKDHCHALLIAHKYAVKRGETGYTSQSANGFSVQRKVGETAYLVEYNQIVAKYGGKSMLTSIGGSTDKSSVYTATKRTDADMSPLALDDTDIPTF